MHAERLLELRLEVAALGRVRLARVRPDRAFGHCDGSGHLLLVRVNVVRLPVLRGVAE